jgi:eukaryotic-like serine/threonine-protein kinase
LNAPFIGKYQVLGELAPGGMAQLFLCCTQGPGGFRKLVVVKRITSEASEDDNFVNMFLDEARVTAAFSNPSIAQVFDLGEDRNGLYVAMEFIAGQNLNEVVHACALQSAVLPLGFSVSVVHDCALALHYAHTFKNMAGEEASVVHRDVAQKNIMVTYDGQVKLLDFGIAKAKNALAKTRVGMVKGTAGYMSPEQVRGDALDGRSDVFSLGVVFWEMVTGRRLFSAQTELEELQLILNSKIERPSAVEPTVPDNLSDVVMKALQRDRSQRFASARDLSKAIASRVPHLLFDSEERAQFMRDRFHDRILTTRKLIESSDDEVEDAMQAFQRESSGAFPVQVKPKHSLKRLAAVAEAPAGKARRLSSSHSTSKRLSKITDREPTDAQAPALETPGVTPAVQSKGRFTRMAEAQRTSPWPYAIAVVVALFGGFIFYKVMLADSLKPEVMVPPVQPLEAENAPINTVEPLPEKTPEPKTPDKDAGVEVKRVLAKGDIVLFLIPAATVTEGKKTLGEGQRIALTLSASVHNLVITGPDNVRRRLSLPVVAGKNKNLKFNLEELPAF